MDQPDRGPAAAAGVLPVLVQHQRRRGLRVAGAQADPDDPAGGRGLRADGGRPAGRRHTERARPAPAGPDDPDNPAPQDPHIVPPFYGKWQAAAASVSPGQPGWLGTLNLDPRHRAGAGMGTQIVQAQRTALMASAWDQVAGVEAANQQLRAAQLSRSAMSSIWTGHLDTATAPTLLTLTAPVQARMLASPRTVYATITGSLVPQRMVSAASRRVTRPLAPVGRRAATLPGLTGPPAARTPLLGRVHSGEVRVGP